ncbi:uncharacterized protein LOC135146553 [Zophobas morio]|uniref:uncharacterized protein LOC135146553 n=1 Tax=Zophobas morio TaxID=2755281 RepID=UPI00308346EE
MDGFSGGQLCVLGATNNPAVIDSALRRPGRFDREIHMKQPDKSSRLSILNALLEHIPLDPSVNLDYVAGMCRGYSGADLNNLCLVTFHRGLSRHVSGQKNVSLSLADFVESMNKVPPSTLKEHMVDVDTLTWEHVGGLNDVIKVLEESVLHPLRHKERYSRFGLSAPKGVLLYGPPGCCKTTLVKILASLGEFSFFTLSGAQMFHSYVGEAERTISSMVKRALQSSPSLLFFDEIDIIGARRGDGDGVQERLLSTLLVEMDGVTVTGHVVFLGATNRISVLDSALIRPGRFDKLIHVPPPDLNARIEIFKVHTRNMKLSEGVDFFSLAKKTAGYTGADIENICREAAMSALRESLSDPLVTPEHFSETLCLLRPMTSFEKTEFYQR